jgi:hypothetical protein
VCGYRGMVNWCWPGVPRALPSIDLVAAPRSGCLGGRGSERGVSEFRRHGCMERAGATEQLPPTTTSLTHVENTLWDPTFVLHRVSQSEPTRDRNVTREARSEEHPQRLGSMALEEGHWGKTQGKAAHGMRTLGSAE